MAIRTKTVEYAWDQRNTLVASTPFTLVDGGGSLSVTVPEQKTLVFRSVVVELYFRDSILADTVAITDSIANVSVGIKVGAQPSFNAKSVDPQWVRQTVAQPMAGLLAVDFTDDFNTYFISSTLDVDCEVEFDIDVCNVNAKLVITYSFEDDAPFADTRVKTVRIPIESPIVQQTGTLVQLGTSQIPALSTGVAGTSFLKESPFSLSIQQYWFEVTCNEAGENDSTLPTAPTFQMGLAIDGAGTSFDGDHPRDVGNNAFYRRIYKPTFDTSTTHGLWARHVKVGSPGAGDFFSPLSVVLCVTYTFDHASMTPGVDLITVSTMLPVQMESTAGRTETGSGREMTAAMDFMVQEDSPVLLQSGVYFTCVSGPSTDEVSFRAGAQGGPRLYDLGNSSGDGAGQGGTVPVMHRVDSGAAIGSGLVLAHGENTLTAKAFVDTSDVLASEVPSGITAMLYLNYEAVLPQDGDGVAAHTTIFNVQSFTTGWEKAVPPGEFPVSREEAAGSALMRTPFISEDDYWVVGAGVLIRAVEDKRSDDVLYNSGLTLSIQAGAGETPPAQRRVCSSNHNGSGVRFLVSQEHRGLSSFFFRHATEPAEKLRLDPETARAWRLNTAAGGLWSTMSFILTHHSITYPQSGSFSNGAGVATPVHWFRADTFEHVATTVSGTNGAATNDDYILTWYDDSIDLFCEANPDPTRAGRSNTITPT